MKDFSEVTSPQIVNPWVNQFATWLTWFVGELSSYCAQHNSTKLSIIPKTCDCFAKR